ncbi:Aquaporin-4 [Liparis tanakae]|uniref:Aquaporin-4 n=1 Tax=Liparis tanakae TaxID=230148 RepID=A0A4Z2II99_9TELE|nr:Aquaporin-4 [Liparis tanakae]
MFRLCSRRKTEKGGLEKASTNFSGTAVAEFGVFSVGVKNTKGTLPNNNCQADRTCLQDAGRKEEGARGGGGQLPPHAVELTGKWDVKVVLDHGPSQTTADKSAMHLLAGLTQQVHRCISVGSALVVDLFITFQLVFAVFATCDHKLNDLKGSSALLSACLCVLGTRLLQIPYTGASMNPARALDHGHMVLGEPLGNPVRIHSGEEERNQRYTVHGRKNTAKTLLFPRSREKLHNEPTACPNSDLLCH